MNLRQNKRKHCSFRVVSVWLICCLTTLTWAGASPVGTSFTYQGQLEDGANPANGDFDFVFNLYDGPDPDTATQIATVTHPAVSVSDGLFTVELDYGPSSFDRDALWLEAEVRPAGVGVMTSLLPLQRITGSPYALFSLDVEDHVKDGLSWSEVASIPAGFADNVDDVGVATEADPTVQANVKDGVSWSEVSSIPAGFADGVDNTGADNLGNHTATQNLRLSGNFLSGDGGSEGVYVDNSGNVGIGTSSPSASSKLDVAGNTRTSGNYQIGSAIALALGSGSVFVGGTGQAGSDNVFVGSLAGSSITSGPRNVYVGKGAGQRTTSGNGNIAIGEGAGDEGTTASDNVYIGEDAGGGIGNNGSDNIFIGNKAGFNETGSDKLYIANSSTASPLIHGDFNAGVLTINGSLVVTGSCTGCSSDQLLKTNITPLHGSLDKLSMMSAVSFDWAVGSDEATTFPRRQLGVIAQEVEKVFPELVGIDTRGYKYVRYQKLVAPLIEAVKELRTANDELRALVCLDHPDVELCG